MGLRAQLGNSGDPERDFARQRLLQVLGAHMMSNPDPRAIGTGLGAGTLASIDARDEWRERQRQIAQDRLAEEFRQSQIAENQAQAERYREMQELALGEQRAKRAEADMALRSKQQLLEMLRAESPEEASFFEGDVEASAEDIRKRLLELRTAEAKAADKADDPVPSRTVFDQFQEYRDGQWRTVATRPEKASAASDEGGDKPLTPAQVESLIRGYMGPGGSDMSRDEALELVRQMPEAVLPAAYRRAEPSPTTGPPRPAGGSGAATPKRPGIGASATVNFAGRKVPITELVEAIRDEPSPAAALQGLVARGVPAETAKMIVGIAFGSS